MTVGTDSGHQNRPDQPPQAFALNDEALLNFAHASYKKVRDVSVALIDGSYHTVDSSDMAFQIAGQLALKEAAAGAGVSLLEPVDRIKVPEFSASISGSGEASLPALDADKVKLSIAGSGEFDAAVSKAFAARLTPRNWLRAPFTTGRITRVKGEIVDLKTLAGLSLL